MHPIKDSQIILNGPTMGNTFWMSDLSKVTLTTIRDNCLHLKIERIHPDAPPLAWLTTQHTTTIQAALLFRMLHLLEPIQAESNQHFKVYAHIFAGLVPLIEEEYGEAPELNRYTELTEYGSELLEKIADQVLVSATLVDQDLNDNWEQGQIQNFNPYQSEGAGVPYLVYELLFHEALLESDYSGRTDYSALSISCVFK